MASAAKKAGRAAAEGLVECYIHAGGKVGVMVELNCETDFVALNESFKQLARDIAMHIVAAQPEYVRREEVPADAFEREKQVQVEKTMSEGKPQAIAEKIVVGRMSKWYEEVCLLDQKWFKDDSKTVDQVVKDLTAVIGENVQVRRFSRFVMGEGLTRRSDDFAAEVAKQAGIA
jgi:elongation factor Ts